MSRPAIANVLRFDPIIEDARDSFRIQAAAIARLADHVDTSFRRALNALLSTDGHVIVAGLGKSGLVGRKIAGTLASTGTPSFFVHAGEAMHGDLGMVTAEDAVVLISNSGETQEVCALLPSLQNLGVPTIALTGNPRSTLARGADISLNVGVESELCPANLAPTNSTLAALAMGDALAVALMRLRGFRPEDFARLHPAGSLGRKLARLGDVAQAAPILRPTDTVADALLALAKSPHSTALVVSRGRVVGSITDVELKASLGDISRPVSEIQTSPPPRLTGAASAADADRLLAETQATAVVVVTSGAPLKLYQPQER